MPLLPLMDIFLPFSTLPYGAFALDILPSASRGFSDLAKPIPPLYCLFSSRRSLVSGPFLPADPNLPLATAAENISDLFRDARPSIRFQYARCLAQNILKTTDIDVLSVDRSQLFQPDSPLRCLLVTQGSILRDATSAHPLFTSFLLLCCLAINDEAQQGGQCGFTILAALLSRFCLQIFTGDREQTRTGTGGDFSRRNYSND